MSDTSNYPMPPDHRAMRDGGVLLPEPDSADSNSDKTESRRRFIQAGLASGALLAGGGVVYGLRFHDADFGVGSRINENQTRGSDPLASLRSDAVDDRVLVIVELQGGNDGLSMVVPYNQGEYYDLRPNLAISPADTLKLDNEIGLHPALVRTQQRGVTVMQGVGSRFNNLSHFTAERYWQRGDISGDKNYRSGFLARCLDPVAGDSPVAGLAIGGYTPYFNAARNTAIAMSNPGMLGYLRENPDDLYRTSLHNVMRTFSGDLPESLNELVGSSYEDLLDLARMSPEQSDRDNENIMLQDGGSLGRQLYFAADMISANVGTRVIHTRMGGYDTHENQNGRYNNLMGQLDASLSGFLDRADAEGFADRVLVCVFSEFGRRASENDTGTDHGQASNVLLAGAIPPGKMGEVNMSDLDDRGNLKTSIPFDSLQASCANWLGLDAGSVFQDSDVEVLF